MFFWKKNPQQNKRDIKTNMHSLNTIQTITWNTSYRASSHPKVTNTSIDTIENLDAERKKKKKKKRVDKMTLVEQKSLKIWLIPTSVLENWIIMLEVLNFYSEMTLKLFQLTENN